MSLDLLRRAAPYVLAIVAIVGLYWMGYSDGRDDAEAEWQAKWNAEAARLATERSQAEQAARAEEQRRQSTIDQVRKDAEQQIARAETDAAAAADAAVGLREQARRLAARAGQCAGNSGATPGGAAEAEPGLVLADLLGRVEAEGRRMAETADRARAAGIACERAYDSLVPSK